MPKAPFAVQCPTCHAKFKMGDPKLIGKKKKCPKCSAPFVIKPVGEKSAETDEFSFLDEHLGGSSEEDWTDRATLPTRRSARKAAPRRPAIEDEFDEDEQPEPRRKAANASPEDKRTKRLLIGMLALIPILLIGLGGLVYMILPQDTLNKFSGGGSSLGEDFVLPTEYVMWESRDSDFQFMYPKDWAASGSSKVTVVHGSIEIYVEDISNKGGGLLGDSFGVGSGNRAPDDVQPVDKLHVVLKDEFEAERPEYREMDLGRHESNPLNSRYSEYRYSNFWGKRSGYRLTYLNTRTPLMVHMECDKDDFETVKPIFQKILPTFSPRGRR